MAQEEKIKQQLCEKFPFLQDSIAIQRERRMYVEVAADKLAEVFDHAVKNMHFQSLSAITGLDEGTSIAVMYHLSEAGGLMLNLRTRVSRESPAIHSVTSYFAYADIYERELMDLLGIQVSGLAEGPRYPLSDDWPKGQFPLRKDWKGKTEETKNA